jgi:hypothetical protein
MGREGKESTSNALAVQLDAQGKIKYDVLARQGHSKDKVMYLDHSLEQTKSTKLNVAVKINLCMNQLQQIGDFPIVIVVWNFQHNRKKIFWKLCKANVMCMFMAENMLHVILQSKSKLSYDRQSFGPSVLVSGHHQGL